LKTFGCGSKIFNHSIEKWCTFICQAWLKGFLERKITIGKGHNKVSDIVFATYTVTEDGTALLESFEDRETLLPALDEKWILHKDVESEPLPDKQPASKPIQRKGKGMNALGVAKELISDRANWYDIKSSDDYNFPGIFTQPYPKRLGYCEDISKLPNYEASNPHFLFSDIQIGKGKARPKRLIEVNVNGKSEKVNY